MICIVDWLLMQLVYRDEFYEHCLMITFVLVNFQDTPTC